LYRFYFILFFRDFLKAFLALYFYRELVTKLFFKDIDLLNLESSLYILSTLPLNKNKLYNIFIFKPLISLKSNSKNTRVISSNIDSFLILIVEASIKSL
jgi:hypothetical protein